METNQIEWNTWAIHFGRWTCDVFFSWFQMSKWLFARCFWHFLVIFFHFSCIRHTFSRMMQYDFGCEHAYFMACICWHCPSSVSVAFSSPSLCSASCFRRLFFFFCNPCNGMGNTVKLAVRFSGMTHFSSSCWRCGVGRRMDFSFCVLSNDPVSVVMPCTFKTSQTYEKKEKQNNHRLFLSHDDTYCGLYDRKYAKMANNKRNTQTEMKESNEEKSERQRKSPLIMKYTVHTNDVWT